jgi:hypothetical protein
MHHISTMPAMNRLSVSFPAPAMTWLRKEAKRLGITVADLLRRIVDDIREAE